MSEGGVHLRDMSFSSPWVSLRQSLQVELAPTLTASLSVSPVGLRQSLEVELPPTLTASEPFSAPLYLCAFLGAFILTILAPLEKKNKKKNKKKMSYGLVALILNSIWRGVCSTR